MNLNSLFKSLTHVMIILNKNENEKSTQWASLTKKEFLISVNYIYYIISDVLAIKNFNLIKN